MTDQPFHRQQAELLPHRSAPATTVGVIGWIRANLFGSWFNSLVTLVIIYVVWMVLS